MATDKFVRHASAQAFAGRLTRLKSCAIDANLYGPNLSASLLGRGGRSSSNTGRVSFDVNGVGIAALDSAECEVYDRVEGDKVWVYARNKINGFRIGVDQRFHLGNAEVEVASIFNPSVAPEQSRGFFLRRAAAEGLEFSGQPISVSFLTSLPANFEELKAFVQKNKLLVEEYEDEDYIVFHAIEGLQGPGKKVGPHQLELDGFGTVQFGVVRASPYFRDFELLNFRFGEKAELEAPHKKTAAVRANLGAAPADEAQTYPISGGATIGAISSNGKGG
jgi:hypothetical protein